MATTVQVALPARASPIARWHLLSLDAPTVAAVWVCFIARANHVQLPLAAPAAMALAVWALYALDRLLDARLLDSRHLDCAQAAAANNLEARHLFHHRHRRRFRVGITLAAAALAALLHLLDPAAIRLYLVEGALLLAWFLVLHATHSAHRLAVQQLPKEPAVGLFFSAAIFIPTIARQPGLRATLLPAAILFAALCSLNCLFIYAWEHDGSSHSNARSGHPITRLAAAHLTALAIALVIASACVAVFQSTSQKPIPGACALAAVLLLALDRNRYWLAANDLRAAADFALLTPLLLWPFLLVR